MGRSLDFADFALSSSLEANRSVKFTPLNISGTQLYNREIIIICGGNGVLHKTVNGI